MPFPARELLDRTLYFKLGLTFTNSRMSIGGNSATIMGSRGCPYKCSFCASPTIHHQKLRFRNGEDIIRELIQLKEKPYEVNDLRFQDDNFPLTLKKTKGLSDFLHENNFRYRASLRVDEQGSSNEILDSLWYSGCREVGFGGESSEDYVLKLNQKGTTVKQNEEAIRRAKEKGFSVRYFIMSGIPGETKDSGKKMAEFIERNHLYLDTVTLTNFIPLPGSDIFNNPEKYGIVILNQDWRKYNIAITREAQKFPFVHLINGLTEEQMVRNLELIKQEVFKRNLSNVNIYNNASVGEPYSSSFIN